MYGNLTGATATYPNVTVGRTLLNDSAYVSLEGNKSQVLVWTHDSENDTNVVLNQACVSQLLIPSPSYVSMKSRD